MRITFVDNVLVEQTGSGFELELQPHLGLISLIAVLRAQGHEMRLYDPKLAFVRDGIRLDGALYGALAEHILADNPQIVGFTSLGCNFACTVRIAEQLRFMRPDIPIVLGGPHATIVDREILECFPAFDLIVRNEAEGTIGAVVDALSGQVPLHTVDGITYRHEGAALRTADGAFLSDLDALPFAAYDAYPIRELGLDVLDIDAGRGCPFTCTFCSTATFFGRKYRLKSSQRLVDELDTLAIQYGIRKFGLTHDLFTVDKRKVRAFCEAVAPRAYAWTCSARIDCVDAALLDVMREAGCVGIYYGIETGSQRLQPIVGKKLNLSLYHPVIEKSLGIGMKTTASFITGFPDESASDQAATLELVRESIRRYGDDLTVQLHLLTPEPGTGLHQRHADSLAFDGHVSDFNFPALHPDDTALIARFPSVFMCHHFYAKGLAREQNIAVTQGLRGLLGLGKQLLNAMIDDYPASFAQMLSDYANFAQGESSDLATTLFGFVRAHWPREHPYVDAVAYLRARWQLRSEDALPAVVRSDMTAIRLSRRVVPIDCTRDGGEVLRRLYAGSPIDVPVLERSAYLLVADATLGSHRMFAADPLTIALVECLREPTTVVALRAHPFEAAELERRLWALVLMGAVVNAQHTDEPVERSVQHESPRSTPSRRIVERRPESRSRTHGSDTADVGVNLEAGILVLHTGFAQLSLDRDV